MQPKTAKRCCASSTKSFDGNTRVSSSVDRISRVVFYRIVFRAGGRHRAGSGMAQTWRRWQRCPLSTVSRILAKRIESIHALRKKFTFIHGDGLQTLRDFTTTPHAVPFVDPPYVVNGRGAAWAARVATSSKSSHGFSGAFLRSFQHVRKEPSRKDMKYD